MPDWQELVQRHLQSLGVSGEREGEIRAELAEHLEDAYQAALRRGMTHEAAMARAQEQVPDWQKLAGRIRRASREEDAMNDRVRKIWLPALVAVSVGHGMWWGMLAAGLNLTIVWDGPRPLMFFFVPWLCLLPLVGAMGAYWSRRTGGGLRDAILVSLAPALGFAMVLMLALGVLLTKERGVAALPPAFQLKLMAATFFSLVCVPGLALLAGALPFLRERAKA